MEPSRKDYLATFYDKQPLEVKRDRRSQENFLFRHGLIYVQVAGFLDMVMTGSEQPG